MLAKFFRDQMSLKELTAESGRINRASPLEILGIKKYVDKDLIFSIFPKSFLNTKESLKGKTYPSSEYMDRL